MKIETIANSPDAFHWLGEINKASAVMVVEQTIVPASLGAHIAEAITEVIAAGNQPDAPRPGDYLILEAALSEAGGPDVTRVHSGRSRQDISATFGVTPRLRHCSTVSIVPTEGCPATHYG